MLPYYPDVLIVTDTQSEADDINALGNRSIFAVKFGSTRVHGRRYKRSVIAIDRRKYTDEDVDYYLSYIAMFKRR